LSLYQLTVEPDTPFAALHAAGKLAIPDPDLARTL
jgi:coproporphyrinogen III oxidase-like Fe-S oxidoreductase